MNLRNLLIALSVLVVCVVCVWGIVFVAALPTLMQRLAQTRDGAPAAATAPARATGSAVTPGALAETPKPAMPVPSKSFTNEFPKRLLFALNTDSATEVKQVNLILQADGIPTSSRYIPEFTPGKKVSVVYEFDMQKNYLPPGVAGDFWWVLKDVDGKETTTKKERFRVDEPTIQWKKIENSQIAIYWYSGEQTFGKAIFDRAVEALARLEKDTGVKMDKQAQIFIYGNRNDFLNALGPNVAGFEGGRAHPEYGIVLIDAGARQLNYARDAAVHEMTHLVMHAKISGALGEFSFPRWLDEGLAMYYETVPGPLGAQFALPLNKAIREDTLLTLRSMTGRFPIDQIELGYAESFSVVDFIYRKHGREKMQQLLLAIKAGGDVDDILNKVLGVNTDALENEWRKDIGAKPRTAATATPATGKPTPFPTFALSTDPTPTPAR